MRIMVLILLVLSFVGCSAESRENSKGTVGIANPASVKCHEDGYRLEIRKSKEGNEYGVCIDKYGNECEEWKYFRGECMLGKKKQETDQRD